MKLTASDLKEIFDYDPQTGDVFYKPRPRRFFKTDFYFKRWNTIYSGRKARTIGASGGTKDYFYASVNQRHVACHRIAFAVMTGKLPDMVDHIDGNGLNNKWSNLRKANRSANQKNMKLMKNNKSGVSGVSYSKGYKGWVAIIYHKNERIPLGCSKDKFEAICKRKSAELKYGYHANHGKNRKFYCSDLDDPSLD